MKWWLRRLRERVRNLLRTPYHRALWLGRQLRLAAARNLQWLPVRRFRLPPESLYPPRGSCDSTRQWISGLDPEENHAASFHEFEPEGELVREPPATVETFIHSEFEKRSRTTLRDNFVATFSRGRVLTQAGTVITPDDRILEDVSYEVGSGATRSLVRTDWRLRPLERIDGKVAVLSVTGWRIYYHWIYHLLPRLELLLRAGFGLEQIDYFCVSSRQKSFQRETLEVLGIPDGKIIDGDEVPYISAETLLVPSLPVLRGDIPKWVCDFLRRSFLPDAPSKKPRKRRLYVSRALADGRRIVNEDAVVELLEQAGFETVTMEGLSVREQASLLADCEAVAGPHGAGFSNLVFCSPKTKVLEIFSPAFVNVLYWGLCNLVDLDYYYMLGRGPREPEYQQTWDSRQDIRVEIPQLEKLLRMAELD